MTSFPALNAASSFSSTTAGMPLLPSGEMPRNSMTVDMVLAVNCPPHAPAPGQAESSMAFSCSALILPRPYAPTASNTS